MSTQPLTIPRVWIDPPLKPRREQLWLDAGKVCHWCGCPTRLVDGDPWDQATIDHIIPRYKGGTNDPENLTSACRLCNNRRSHEDARNLPEGHLLGKYKVDSNGKIVTGTKGGRSRYVVLSGDEKKALMAKMDKPISLRLPAGEVLKEQRDQGLKYISELQTKIVELQKELDHWKTVSSDFESLSIVRIIRKRLAKWLLWEN